ncbi:putative ThiS family protein [Desulfosarcina cetonica]|uniref:MoaD/ThiS family protein n=1 Tax=Desulfosarcina cetonica TaxID=90730 RepID=UPI0006CF9CF5|nr:MoaD/ThiS family protein [Desulfosarcina cetonica]VTR65963.1 putative ThiS family protein [Desulfosarcina cetonica]
MTQNQDIVVRLATVLARHTGNQKELACPVRGGDDLMTLLEDLDGHYAGLKTMICASREEIIDSINVYVNGDNVRYLQGLKTPLKGGDVINIIPAAAAG